MKLISETFENGGPKGPAHPPIHQTMSPVLLADPRTFASGPPHDAFKLLRREAPIAWNEEPTPVQQGFWSITRYADVARVNNDPRTFSSQRGGILMAYGPRESPMTRAAIDAMICMDAPAHLQIRREHMSYFTPAYLRGVKDKVAAETTRLLDAMAPMGECDLVEQRSAQLPLFTLCEILGVPPSDRPRFLHWMHFLEKSNSLRSLHEDGAQGRFDYEQFIRDFNDAVGEMFEYGCACCTNAAEPQADLMSAIACAQLDGEPLNDGAHRLLPQIASPATTPLATPSAAQCTCSAAFRARRKSCWPIPSGAAPSTVHPHDQPNLVCGARRGMSRSPDGRRRGRR
jgi:cytochrome P450